MKTGKRILSILLAALLMLCGTVTAASAATSCNGNHSWSGWQGISPTCDQAGSRHRVCYVCGATENETIPALGHSWNGGAVTAQPTCTSGGTRVYTCTRCGATRTEGIGALGHSYGGIQVTKPSTCASMGESFQVCSRCGDRITHVMPKNENHSWDEGVITKEPEGLTPGEKTYTCTLCGATRTEKLEPVTNLFSNLSSFIGGVSLRNYGNPADENMLHIVTQPEGGTIPHGGSAVLTVAAEGGEEPYTYEWWYEPELSKVSASQVAGLIFDQGLDVSTAVQQAQEKTKPATVVSVGEWLQTHLDGLVTHTQTATMQTEPLEAKPFNPLAKCMGSSGDPECYAWNAGTYWCVVYDSAGHHVTSNEAKVTDALYIAVQPESKNIFGIDSTTLTCKAAGGSGNYSYTWYGSEGITGRVLSDEASFSANQVGTYHCFVVDYETLETVDSNSAQVYSDEETQVDMRPVITLQPSDITLEYRPDDKYSWSMTCQAKAYDDKNENLKYEWFGKTNTGWSPISASETLSRSYDHGTFRCTVTDKRNGKYVSSNEAKVQTALSCRIVSVDPYTWGRGKLTFEVIGGTAPYEVKIYQHRAIGAELNPETNSYEIAYADVFYKTVTLNESGYGTESVMTNYSFVLIMDTDWTHGEPVLQTGNIEHFIVATDSEGRTGKSEIK